jgi:hypothetical protein
MAHAAAEASRMYAERVLEIFDALEAIDPELVKAGLDLFGDRQRLASYLTEANPPSLSGHTCYEALAAGERSRVLDLFVAAAHGFCA